MSMPESIYMIGQISAGVKETYLWRERVRKFFEGDKRITLIDPCTNAFNRSILKNATTNYTGKVYKIKGTDLLVPKDFSYVKRSTMGMANMIHYDPSKPILGTAFELAWYYAMQKTVVGIFDGDIKKDVHCNHPFIRSAIKVWVKDEIEACKIIKQFYLDPSDSDPF